MLVGAYPFERPEDKHDNQKLQKMIQRILRVEVNYPRSLSPECHDLLSKILVREPHKRITVEGIQSHPWYMKNLPPGVKEMNNNLVIPHEGLQVCWCYGFIMCICQYFAVSSLTALFPFCLVCTLVTQAFN